MSLSYVDLAENLKVYARCVNRFGGSFIVSAGHINCGWMLGTGLGKKVDAQFVKEEYKTFLNKDKPKRPATKEEKREECRKKGIFVAADDKDFEHTIFEKPSATVRPAVSKGKKTKGLRWKKKTVREKKPKEETSKSEDAEDAEKKASTSEALKKTSSAVAVDVKKSSPNVDPAPKKSSSIVEASKKDKEGNGVRKRKSKNGGKRHNVEQEKSSRGKEVVVTTPAVKEEGSLSNTGSTQPSVVFDSTQKASLTAVASTDTPVEDKPLVIEETQRMSVVPAPKEPKELSPKNKGQEPSLVCDNTQRSTFSMDTTSDLRTATPSGIECSTSTSYTLRQPVQTPVTPKDTDDVFGKMEDDEFEKILAQENAKCAVSDKEAVTAARKILQVAYKEKAFEKVLTKEENEILAKFFSGKVPYNNEVLRTLDKALDKTIDWMKTNNVKMTDETKALIEKRGAVKAAMFEAILTSPQYIPKSWAKKYEELRVQSQMETHGVNWARVLLYYPNQKRFGDGPEDQFGNFTRSKRDWLLGILLGPSDSKTFEETKREEECKGMYFDTAMMEKAKVHADEDKSVLSSLKH